MEQLLQRAGSQAVTFAIRSGISIASGYAFKTVSKFLDTVPTEDTAELDAIQKRLETSIKVLIPAIDLIELIASRGHTSLEYTLQLTRELRKEIDKFQLGVENEYDKISASKNSDVRKVAIQRVRDSLQNLLKQVEEAIPLITLALTTSGANLTASLPDYVSPGRFLQAANLLTSADSRFDGKTPVNVGPEFSLIFYDIFYSSNRAQSGLANNDITWKEEFAKCRAQLVRKCGDEEYIYCLKLREDFDDGRYHDDDENPRVIDIDVKTITRLFFTASGRLLEIPESQSPVLVLKLNKYFEGTRAIQKITTENEYASPENVEWVAFETALDTPPDSESDYSSDDGYGTSGEDLADELQKLQISKPSITALSVLEYLLRLAALQANDQKSMYDVHDERLSLYLRDEANSRHSRDTERATVASDETPRSVRVSRRNSPFSTPSEKSPRGDTSRDSSLVATPWEKDRLLKTPHLKAPQLPSEISQSPFRDSPVKARKPKSKKS